MYKVYQEIELEEREKDETEFCGGPLGIGNQRL